MKGNFCRPQKKLTEEKAATAKVNEIHFSPSQCTVKKWYI